MSDQILLLFMATWSDNRLLFQLFLPFLRKGLNRTKQPNIDASLRNCFANYFPDGVIFRAVLVRDHFCINKEVKFKMKAPFPILKRRIFKKVFKLIKQYACFLQINNMSQGTEHIHPVRYETLVNKLKQEEDLGLISVQEFQCFLDAILHEDILEEILHEGDVINYEEQIKEEEKTVGIQKLPNFVEEHLPQDVVDGDVDESENTMNNEELVKQREEMIMLVPELQSFLDRELKEIDLDDMLHEGVSMSYEENDLLNYGGIYPMRTSNFR